MIDRWGLIMELAANVMFELTGIFKEASETVPPVHAWVRQDCREDVTFMSHLFDVEDVFHRFLGIAPLHSLAEQILRLHPFWLTIAPLMDM